ncbi:MAG: hypothetical protein ACLFUB_15145 [Cyclobacteriaceae bacterium]
MHQIRILLSLIISVYCLKALQAISFSSFSFEQEGQRLLILGVGCLLIPALWSQSTTVRLRSIHVVRRVRLLLSALFIFKLAELFSAHTFSYLFSQFSYELLITVSLILGLLFLWMRSVEQLRLKDKSE